MKYRIYIDEVGNSDLESSEDPNHRFLSLTGVILSLDFVQTVLSPQMDDLKLRYFGSHPDEPVIFHRKELLGAKPPFAALRDPEIRRRFDAELLSALDRWDYRVITVSMDKRKHKETYQTWRYDPYHYCMAVMIERYFFFLDQAAGTGDVMAESRGGKDDLRLKASFDHLWSHGTEYVDAKRFQRVLTSRQLKVKPKQNNIAGLQLADLIAHPSRNEILRDHGLAVDPIRPFGEQIVAILNRKYYQRGGTIYGKKFL